MSYLRAENLLARLKRDKDMHFARERRREAGLLEPPRRLPKSSRGGGHGGRSAGVLTGALAPSRHSYFIVLKEVC